MFNQ
jgi:hypothetical protein